MLRKSIRNASLFIIAIIMLAGTFTPAGADPKNEQAAAQVATDIPIPKPMFINGLHARCGKIQDTGKQDRCHLLAANIRLEGRAIEMRGRRLNGMITRFKVEFGNPIIEETAAVK